MSEERKKSVWPWVVALLILLPVLYVASFGPACWLLDKQSLPEAPFTIIYEPCIRLSDSGPVCVKFALWRWVELCGGEWMLAEIIARRSFVLAPYRNVTGFEPGRG